MILTGNNPQTVHLHHHPFLLFSLTLLVITINNFISATNDTITILSSTQPITNSQTLISSGGIFKLGFFSPSNSTNKYIGIWYNNIPEQNVVWVANRDNPLKSSSSSSSSGTLRIGSDGNLQIFDDSLGFVIWTTNISHIYYNNSFAELSDFGNLVLRQANDRKILWQSFDNPTDTFLPTMKIGGSKKTGKKIQIRSWKTQLDPSPGDFSAGLELTDIPQIVLLGAFRRRIWRSGPWNNKIFIGVPAMDNAYSDGFHLSKDPQDDSVYLTYHYGDGSLRQIKVDHNGELFEEMLDVENKKFVQIYSVKDDSCEYYNKCGPFGNCNMFKSPCTCIRGYKPKNQEEWNRGNWSGGCTRNTELQCEANNSSSSSSTSNNGLKIGKEDGFLKMEKMKVPDFGYWLERASDEKKCEKECLKNCSCLAYWYDNGVGCMIWGGNLIDIQKFPLGGGDLHIRVANSELDNKNMLKVIVIVTVLMGIFTIGITTYFYRRWLVKPRENRNKEMELLLYDIHSSDRESSARTNGSDLTIFKLKKLESATNNFCEANKLGEGGFGPVYKGQFMDGQEIAVKRLSVNSGQGLEEFKNEVRVILRLQHRNLVRLLGCCVEGDEKMLVYEYMPNKSLDAFLFDPTGQTILNWRTRFKIIEGISRGVLYLHRDSRLRVIHRDLKASNILLDEELNPKISDFGMARIFGGTDELQANTRRVVGTYGYMSPEYAMQGQFSEKSDVFSFGVLLLEIVSGKRNTSFDHPELSLSLLPYAWQLWNENMARLLIDPSLLSSDDIIIDEVEILRCIHVGLLCVQEYANDRPTMSTTLSMLNSEIATLPSPTQPAFSLSQRSSPAGSINYVTITQIEGR